MASFMERFFWTFRLMSSRKHIHRAPIIASSEEHRLPLPPTKALITTQVARREEHERGATGLRQGKERKVSHRTTTSIHSNTPTFCAPRFLSALEQGVRDQGGRKGEAGSTHHDAAHRQAQCPREKGLRGHRGRGAHAQLK